MSKDHKSPDYKLVSFFEKSRDKWKDKYYSIRSSVQGDLNALCKKVYYYKTKSDELTEELNKLKDELTELKKKHN